MNKHMLAYLMVGSIAALIALQAFNTVGFSLEMGVLIGFGAFLSHCILTELVRLQKLKAATVSDSQ